MRSRYNRLQNPKTAPTAALALVFVPHGVMENQTIASDSAILLIAHGSRRGAANDDLRQLAAMLSERCPAEIIECAYLELAEPTIPQGMQACIERGARRVRMLPYFLSAGAHVSEDLTKYRREFAQAWPGVKVQLCPPIGLHDKMVEILLERLQQSAEP